MGRRDDHRSDRPHDRRRSRTALLIGLIAMAIAVLEPAGAAVAEPTPVHWVLFDLPPGSSLEDGLPGRGFVGEFLRHVMARTPDHRHSFERGSVARAVGLMRQGAPVCCPSLLVTPDRTRDMVFSRPIAYSLPLHVVVRADMLDRLAPHRTADGAIAADRLVADTKLVTTITEQRVYPPLIAAALAKTAARAHVIRANVDFDTPFRQLVAGWIDYLFAFPGEVRWQVARAGGPTGIRLVPLPIAGMPAYVTVHAACTRSSWGAAVVARIDTILATAGPRPPWLERYLADLDDETAAQLETILAER